MKKLSIISIGALVTLVAVHAQDPRPEENPPEPSKVWGYVTLRDPADPNNLHLPGATSWDQSSEFESQLTRTSVSQFSVVFREPTGAEHRVDLPPVLFPYFTPPDGLVYNTDPGHAVLAIRYEIRFAHFTSTMAYQPTFFPQELISGPGFADWLTGVNPEPEPTASNVYSPAEATPFPTYRVRPVADEIRSFGVGRPRVLGIRDRCPGNAHEFTRSTSCGGADADRSVARNTRIGSS